MKLLFMLMSTSAHVLRSSLLLVDCSLATANQKAGQLIQATDSLPKGLDVRSVAGPSQVLTQPHSDACLGREPDVDDRL